MHTTADVSAFSRRYGSQDMADILSGDHRVWHYQNVWLAGLVAMRATLHEPFMRPSLVKSIDLYIEVLKDLGDQVITSQDERDFAENVTRHELEASRLLTSQFIRAEIAKRYPDFDTSTLHDVLHLGMTSSDVQDNADYEVYDEAIDLLLDKGRTLVENLSKKVEENKSLVCVGYTHLQVAEPTTMGYRLATHLSDIIGCMIGLAKINLHRKGIGGAVGTMADQFAHTIGPMGANHFTLAYISAMDEIRNQDRMDFEPARPSIDVSAATGQTASRLPLMTLAQALSAFAMALHRLALNVRLLSMTGEASEGRAARQVGSSAMPHKVNPIMSENICGLARVVEGHVNTLWHTYSNQGLERTLDDSSVNRVVWPEILLAMDEIIGKASHMVGMLRFNKPYIAELVERNRVYLSQSYLLSWLVRNIPGKTREQFHEELGLLAKESPYNEGEFLLDLVRAFPEIETIMGSPGLIRDMLGTSTEILDEAERRAELLASYGMNVAGSLHR